MVTALPASPQTHHAMYWHRSYRADPKAAALADRHYSRKTAGSRQFTPPGRCLVLLTSPAQALWVTSWPYTPYVMHAWAGAWLCSLFRNESAYLSSDLIGQAVAATRWKWNEPPTKGMITFVDTVRVRRKRDWGRCFRKAGFQPVGWTKNGLLTLQLFPQDMPEATPAIGMQLPLFAPISQKEVCE